MSQQAQKTNKKGRKDKKNATSLDWKIWQESVQYKYVKYNHFKVFLYFKSTKKTLKWLYFAYLYWTDSCQIFHVERCSGHNHNVHILVFINWWVRGIWGDRNLASPIEWLVILTTCDESTEIFYNFDKNVQNCDNNMYQTYNNLFLSPAATSVIPVGRECPFLQ